MTYCHGVMSTRTVRSAEREPRRQAGREGEETEGLERRSSSELVPHHWDRPGWGPKATSAPAGLDSNSRTAESTESPSCASGVQPVWGGGCRHHFPFQRHTARQGWARHRGLGDLCSGPCTKPSCIPQALPPKMPAMTGKAAASGAPGPQIMPS